MSSLNPTDYVVIGGYFCLLMVLGLWFRRRAAVSLEEYFLAGRKMPWWAMGISGMASYVDMAGTMLIVSFLYMLGPRGLYIEFRGGAVLVLTFMLLWSGKWHYRSGCMTGAEWMEYRFGRGWGGRTARLLSAVAVIVTATPAGTAAGAAYVVGSSLAVDTGAIVPHRSAGQVTVHVTPAPRASLRTAAESRAVEPAWTVATAGETVTVIGGAGAPGEHAERHAEISTALRLPNEQLTRDEPFTAGLLSRRPCVAITGPTDARETPGQRSVNPISRVDPDAA